MLFAAISPLLMTGAFAERLRFWRVPTPLSLACAPIHHTIPAVRPLSPPLLLACLRGCLLSHLHADADAASKALQ